VYPAFEAVPHDPSCAYCSGRREPARFPVDAIYCIAVAEATDRIARVTEHFHAIGLCRQVVFYVSHRETGTERGVWRAHRAVARNALTNGHRRVLVLEDDVVFRQTVPKLARRVERAFAKLPPDWWGLFLGHLPVQAYFVGRGLIRSRSLLLHAYVANLPLLQWLDTSEPMSAEVPMWSFIGASIDSAVSLLPSMYALVPMAVMQKNYGDLRIDPRVGADGRRRRLTDINRWRYLAIFYGPSVMEWLSIVLAPFHWLTMEPLIRRIRTGTSTDAKVIRAAGLFDDAFYLTTYPDVARTGMDPLFHYLEYGAREKRRPNPDFDPIFYAGQVKTLRPSENPLLHYIAVGRPSGYATKP
jgi:GR25 family glycosyltransferase involved in LPS biosynthesis